MSLLDWRFYQDIEEQNGNEDDEGGRKGRRMIYVA
jgi:hypothetical protein